ncbi:MAG: hypothetical protein KGJ09_01315 [Candidatus Omnitrophica bacterium]|nr:hypothetical protein [Candidatus Omnitrophota bacterium]MDE2008699.1 hypothetical protein [Candidatus Omnitrophota bacterium]MDE2214840.1 hypothetical protein [Candidatus Omnitrophota bacterium]MDE2231960.1 hypothetical protein [Candidatus Omnitrophota bacterium]
MMTRGKILRTEKTHYHDEPGYQASIMRQPHRKISPKRRVQVHISRRIKKGPMESKG